MKYPQPALWRCALIDVHDGDTITVHVDKGGVNETSEIWHIRLKDIYAPELSQPGGPESRDNLRTLLQNANDGSLWPYMLQTFRTPLSDLDLMTFNRYVGTIWGADNVQINAVQETWIKSQGYSGGIGSK